MEAEGKVLTATYKCTGTNKNKTSKQKKLYTVIQISKQKDQRHKGAVFRVYLITALRIALRNTLLAQYCPKWTRSRIGTADEIPYYK